MADFNKNDRAAERPFLLDVSRLIWRAWRGRPPTGIDRVCLAYCEHFGPKSLAVIQRRGSIVVLSSRQSDRLFQLLCQGAEVSRMKLAAGLLAAMVTARGRPARRGMTYFNVGHTGLDDPSIPRWIVRNDVRAIYLIHDLIPLTHPEYCRPGEDSKHARRMMHALESASGIIANSRETLSELDRFATFRGLKMPPSVVAWLNGQDAPANVAPVRLERPYFVTVGTIEARKNHLLLLRAWTEFVGKMGRAAPILVIIGSRGWEAEESITTLDDLGPLHGTVHEIGGCDDEALAAWIAGARALLMPSFVEGFGLPVIEALQLGTPVIASDLAVYREIVGDTPTYRDPSDVDSWSKAILDFIQNGPERRRQLAAIESYRAPTWQEHFRIVEAWVAERDSNTF
jgi:glycosyltransferase involved in cell wall biosynthesis